MGLIPASAATRNPVLRRPPILEDYINVTSTGGDRAFLVLRADPVGTGVQVGAIWPWGLARLATAFLWDWQASCCSGKGPRQHIHTGTQGTAQGVHLTWRRGAVSLSFFPFSSSSTFLHLP